MEPENRTDRREFIFLGFSEGGKFLSFIFLSLYLMILLGNLTIFNIIRVDSHLHLPMYFFLSHLSLLDICYSSVTLPCILVNSMTGNRRISFRGCMTQIYFFVSLGGAECLLLAAMAYDRLVAICNPLRYAIIINHLLCIQLTAASWLGGFLNSILHTALTSELPFCGASNINHYFCDVPPLIQLSCTQSHTSQNVLYVVSVFLGITPFVFVVVSYTRIIISILKISSAKGRRKAFSTCSSHLIVVTVFYITANLNYIGPSPGDSFDLVQLSTLLYSLLTPLFNPVIYCLRNKEVKTALKRILGSPLSTVNV
ncbi:olfactory receptor 5V1-like [Ambystoma mexicanum]|uniref:olfactory receptor 5V1-like n=1 Tax=Ambystoma mexicanum TaxID=8296 RepID=UPI0037E95E08